MRIHRLPIAALLIALFFASTVRAQLPEAVKRYVDSSTLVLVRGDVSKLDVDALMQFVRSLAQEVPEEDRAQFEKMLAETEQGLKGVEAGLQPVIDAGAGEIYMVVSPAPLMQQVPPTVIVPTENEAQRDAVLEFLRQTPMKHEAVEGAVLIGEPVAIAIAKAIRPQPRPELEAAFAGDGEGRAMSAVFVPTPLVSVFGLQALREAAKESPAIPAELADTLEKLALARVDVSLPPEPNGLIELRFADEASAGRMNTFLEAMRQLGGAKATEAIGAESAAAVAEAVAATHEGASVRVEVTAQELRQSLGGPLIAALQQAREEATMVKTGSNLRHLGQMMRQYAIARDDKDLPREQRGAYPDTLEELRRAVIEEQEVDPASFDAVMTNPRTGEANGFVYLGAGKTDSADSGTVLMYEKAPAGGYSSLQPRGVSVLFADGRVEVVLLERLEELAQEQGFEIEALEE